MIKTITLDGLTSVTVKESPFDMARFCWIYNHSDSDVFASCVNSDCTENADGVLRVPAGETRMLDTESHETLYLNGSGSVEIITSAFAVCPFKLSVKGGVSYELPIATTEILGGVIPDGTSITVDENGVISAVGSGETNYIIQYGVFYSSNTTAQTIKFPRAYTDIPVVVASCFTDSDSTGSSGARIPIIQRISASEFKYYIVTGSMNNAYGTVNWIAIGT